MIKSVITIYINIYQLYASKLKFKYNVKIKKMSYLSNYPSSEPLRLCLDIKKLKKLVCKQIIKLSEGFDLLHKYYKF